MDEPQRVKLVREFFQHREVKKHQLESFFQQGVLFMGCLRHDSLETNNEAAIYLEYNNVLDMRTAFIKKVLQCSKAFSVHGSACSVM